MDRRKLAYIALVITIIYGGLFAVIGADSRSVYAPIGGIVVAIAWGSASACSAVTRRGPTAADDADCPMRVLCWET